MKTTIWCAIAFTFFLSQYSFAAEVNKVLVVVSTANELTLANGKKHKTGFFLGELGEPLMALEESGFSFDIATLGGARPTVDEDSLRWIYWFFAKDQKDEVVNYLKSLVQLEKPLVLEDLSQADLEEYVGVFIPGGHAPMVDFVDNPILGNVLRHFHQKQKPTAMICHAPVSLLSVQIDGKWACQGYELSVFSNFEEFFAELFFLGGKVPFYPETELEKSGAIISNTLFPWSSRVTVDRELVTGQNPYSPKEFGDAFVEALKKYVRN